MSAQNKEPTKNHIKGGPLLERSNNPDKTATLVAEMVDKNYNFRFQIISSTKLGLYDLCAGTPGPKHTS